MTFMALQKKAKIIISGTQHPDRALSGPAEQLLWMWWMGMLNRRYFPGILELLRREATCQKPCLVPEKDHRKGQDLNLCVASSYLFQPTAISSSGQASRSIYRHVFIQRYELCHIWDRDHHCHTQQAHFIHLGTDGCRGLWRKYRSGQKEQQWPISKWPLNISLPWQQ